MKDKKEIEQLARQLCPEGNKSGFLNEQKWMNQNRENRIEGFIKGYEQAQADVSDGWIDIKEHGLPTDSTSKYFIAMNGIHHNHLYRLSEVIEKHKEFEITHYLPFNLPTPPQLKQK